MSDEQGLISHKHLMTVEAYMSEIAASHAKTAANYEKLLGIMSKTGTDAQAAVFSSKVIPIYKSYPFFFQPILDGTTNPRQELAFREPSKRITKKNKKCTTF